MRKLKKRLLILLSLVLLIGGGYGAYKLYRRHILVKHWDSITIGMSQEAVKELLGSPDIIYVRQDVDAKDKVGTIVDIIFLDSALEKWAYGRRWLFEFHAQFPFVKRVREGLLKPEPDDHVIYFSPSGRVVKKVYPYGSAKK